METRNKKSCMPNPCSVSNILVLLQSLMEKIKTDNVREPGALTQTNEINVYFGQLQFNKWKTNKVTCNFPHGSSLVSIFLDSVNA